MGPPAPMPWLRVAAAAIADLAAPRDCAGCGQPGAAWCPACRHWTAAPRRVSPVPAPSGLPPLWAAGAYDGPLRSAVLAWKDDGRCDLRGDWGRALAACASLALRGHAASSGILVVPAPSAPATVRARGRDHGWDLARAASAALRADGRPAHAARLLAHRRAVGDQAGLSAAQRAANLSGALRARTPRGGWPWAVLLVDDICTTGSTAAEAARALAEVGLPPTACAVLAATPRRSALGTSDGMRGRDSLD